MLNRIAVLCLLALTGCPGPGPGGTGGGSGTGGGTGTGGGGNPNATLLSIAVTPAAKTVGRGAMQQFTATASWSDSTTSDVTATTTWGTSMPAVATISAAGVLSALTEGATDVTAAFQGKNATTALTVSGVALVSIAVNPGTPDLGIGATQAFVATGTYFDQSTRNITAQAMWSSSAPAIAPVTSAGVATASTLGMTTLTAALDGISGTTQLTVSAKKLTAIKITPAFLSINVGTTSPLTATGTYSDGSTANVTSTVTWESSGPMYLTVSSAGVVSGVAAVSGNWVYARSGGVTGRNNVAVTSTMYPLTSIALRPQTMYVGEQFPAPQLDAVFGPVGQNFTRVEWTSSDPTVATIDYELGVSALKAGVTTLTATTYNNAGPLTAMNTLTVSEPPLQMIDVSAGAPGGVTLAMGTTLQLTATGVYSNTALNKDLTSAVTWSSNNMAAVTVDSMGLVRGVSSGTATISALSAGVTGTLMVTVPSTAPPQMTVTLSPSDDNTIGISSLNAARETTAFPVNAVLATPGLGVGCAWFWSPPIGPAPEHIDASCYDALVKFDLASLAGKTIVSAKLRLTTKVYGVGFVPRRWYLYALASQWNAGVTWAQSYSFQHYVYSETQHDPPYYSGQVYEVDQTTTVRNWVGGSYVNGGWQMGIINVVYPALSSSSLDVFEFQSKEDPGGNGPKLVVTYQ